MSALRDSLFVTGLGDLWLMAIFVMTASTMAFSGAHLWRESKQNTGVHRGRVFPIVAWLLAAYWAQQAILRGWWAVVNMASGVVGAANKFSMAQAVGLIPYGSVWMAVSMSVTVLFLVLLLKGGWRRFRRSSSILYSFLITVACSLAACGAAIMLAEEYSK